MNESRRRPGQVRDAILAFLRTQRDGATLKEIRDAVNEAVGGSGVPQSSVRSYLRLNTPGVFVRTGRGTYKLSRK